MTGHIEPSADARAAAQAAAEMFAALIGAGFTEDQAIKILSQFMASTSGGE